MRRYFYNIKTGYSLPTNPENSAGADEEECDNLNYIAQTNNWVVIELTDDQYESFKAHGYIKFN